MAAPSSAYLAQSKTTVINIGYSVPIPLELLSTGLRLWAELHMHRNKLAFDDLLMIWATAVSVGLCISGLACGPPYGMGRHIESLSKADVQSFMRGDYIFSHFYDVAIASTKLSVLALYYRAFVSNTFRRVVLATAVFVVLWLLTMEVVLGFQCRPLQKFWNPDIEGDCFNLVAFTFFTNITNLAADIWIFILPLPVIARLRISTKKRVGLSLLFGVGLATCAVSAARLTVVVAHGSPDFTWSSVPLGILSVWEPLGGILCANLPVTYRLLVAISQRVLCRASSEQHERGPHSWYYRHRLARQTQHRRLHTSTMNTQDILGIKSTDQSVSTADNTLHQTIHSAESVMV